MYVLPAIDLMDGKCVRLIQGRYDKQIIYRDDPVAQAHDFIDAGAQWLHIIDLDGAKAGKVENLDAISKVTAIGKLKIEVGGGIRDEGSIKTLLDNGVKRIIIGTRAVTDFDWFSEMAEKYSGRIVLGLDARGSKVSTEGWTKECTEPMLDFARKADELPLAAIIYTDIDRDGMLSGPNLERTKSLVDAVDTPIVAAGGMNVVEDIDTLKPTGVDGVVIGRAIYEGTLDVAKAIIAAKS